MLASSSSSSSEAKDVKEEAASSVVPPVAAKLAETEVIVVKDRDEGDDLEHRDKGRSESEVVRELHAQLK